MPSHAKHTRIVCMNLLVFLPRHCAAKREKSWQFLGAAGAGAGIGAGIGAGFGATGLVGRILFASPVPAAIGALLVELVAFVDSRALHKAEQLSSAISGHPAFSHCWTNATKV